ncbi:MAG TPA: aryl-sulfate sulfotransferase [Chthoniobacterales bacterium]|jgi:hypothetical protein
MKTSSILAALLVLALAPLAHATDADNTTITITSQTAGPTPFISQLTLTASDATVLKDIAFTIAAKPGAKARALSGTYSLGYLIAHGDLTPPSNQIFLPVYGLYAGFANTVTLTYNFVDGSSKKATTSITTAIFDDQGCGYNSPTVLKARSDEALSYDYIFIRSGCGNYSPVIVDSDGILRWVSTMGVPNALTGSSIFYQGAVYEGINSDLYRVDLDGTVTLLKDYGGSPYNVTAFHHNIESGKFGLMVEVDTTNQVESTLMEVDLSGNVIKTFSMANIISTAMTAGGDDPSQFVYPPPDDWFHNNASTYNRADDSLIVSSRENFVICVDYQTGGIKWILGDQTKKWYQFPSLAKFALSIGTGSLPPIGQHAISQTYDGDLLLFDDGLNSMFQTPPGMNRNYSSPRKYELDLSDVSGDNVPPGAASVVWNYEQNESIYSPICDSVYEDAPNNYLVDYAAIGYPTSQQDLAQLLGLNPAGDQVFYYQYDTVLCDTAYNSLPIHLENSKYPAIGPQALNFSTRGDVSNGDNSLIGGFIVTGTGNKQVALRVLGPSLSSKGVTNALANPVLTLYNSSKQVVATNDDWQSSVATAATLTANGLAPTSPLEAATVQTLAPGAYTVVATSKDGSSGVGLVEIYDLAPAVGSLLGNISTRGYVGTGEDVLISGFIVGDTANATTIVRALGPSLSSTGVSSPLANPLLTIYDDNGTAIAENDDWQTGVYHEDVIKNNLAPKDAVESALVFHPAAGNYTAIVTGAGGGTGVALVEVFDLDQPPE